MKSQAAVLMLRELYPDDIIILSEGEIPLV